jgi:hypothetical protein
MRPTVQNPEWLRVTFYRHRGHSALSTELQQLNAHFVGEWTQSA